MKPAVHRLPGTVSHRVKQSIALQVQQTYRVDVCGVAVRSRARPARARQPCRRAGSSTSGLPWSRTARMLVAQPTPRSRATAATGGRPYRPAGRPPPEPARSAPPEDEPRPPARSRFPYRRQARCDRYRPDTHRQHHRGSERRRCPPPEASILLGASLGASGRTAAVAHGLPCPFRSRLLPVCCPTRASGTAPAWRKRPARPVTRAVVGWR
jgi:hypothetical protein